MRIKKSISSNGQMQYFCGENMISVTQYNLLLNNLFVESSNLVGVAETNESMSQVQKKYLNLLKGGSSDVTVYGDQEIQSFLESLPLIKRLLEPTELCKYFHLLIKNKDHTMDLYNFLRLRKVSNPEDYYFETYIEQLFKIVSQIYEIIKSLNPEIKYIIICPGDSPSKPITLLRTLIQYQPMEHLMFLQFPLTRVKSWKDDDLDRYLKNKIPESAAAGLATKFLYVDFISKEEKTKKALEKSLTNILKKKITFHQVFDIGNDNGIELNGFFEMAETRNARCMDKNESNEVEFFDKTLCNLFLLKCMETLEHCYKGWFSFLDENVDQMVLKFLDGYDESFNVKDQDKHEFKLHEDYSAYTL